MERKGDFDAYDGLVARRVKVKVSFEISDVKPFMAMYELWGWKYCNEKLYGDVVLIMVRIEMVEWSNFCGKWFIL